MLAKLLYWLHRGKRERRAAHIHAMEIDLGMRKAEAQDYVNIFHVPPFPYPANGYPGVNFFGAAHPPQIIPTKVEVE